MVPEIFEIWLWNRNIHWSSFFRRSKNSKTMDKKGNAQNPEIKSKIKNQCMGSNFKKKLKK